MTVAAPERTGRRHAPRKPTSRPARPGPRAAGSRPRRGKAPARAGGERAVGQRGGHRAAAHRGAGARSATRAGAKTRARPKARSGPATRAERRASTQARRARFLVAGALTVSVLVLVAWFPASALYHQRQQLNAATAQLGQLRSQDRALRAERVALASPAEVARIARQQFQLVPPGARAYAVLPPNGGSADSPYAGDPGFQPLVAPSNAQLPAGSASTARAPAAGAHPTATSATTPGTSPGSASAARSTPSLADRILQTLEFWR